jgi:hypothetical protein
LGSFRIITVFRKLARDDEPIRKVLWDDKTEQHWHAKRFAMATDKQLKANRANARKSMGPKKPGG